MARLRCMLIGDVVGHPGRTMFAKWAPRLKEKFLIDFLVVNGENAADNGRGIAPKHVSFFTHHGADCITSGNHIWAQKDIYETMRKPNTPLLRPANFPHTCPGVGYRFHEVQGYTVGVVNIQGRTFMQQQVDCPFRTMDSLLPFLRNKTPILLVDFHAETTSEKQAMGFYLDGRVSVVVGTHTHVQTADEHILPKGTGYISDLGYGGALYSMLGMQKEPLIERFLTQMPVRFQVEKEGPITLHGIWLEIDTDTGKTMHIERIRLVDNDLAL